MKTLPKIDPVKVTIKVKNDKNEPIVNSHVLLLADNNTFLEGKTRGDGLVNFEVKTRRIYTVMVSHENYVSSIQEKYDPKDDMKFSEKKTQTLIAVIGN